MNKQEKMKAWTAKKLEENPDFVRNMKRKYREANREAIAEYRRENGERIKEQQRQRWQELYWAMSDEEIQQRAAHSTEWRRNNRKRAQAISSRSYYKNRTTIRQKLNKWKYNEFDFTMLGITMRVTVVGVSRTKCQVRLPLTGEVIEVLKTELKAVSE